MTSTVTGHSGDHHRPDGVSPSACPAAGRTQFHTNPNLAIEHRGDPSRPLPKICAGTAGVCGRFRSRGGQIPNWPVPGTASGEEATLYGLRPDTVFLGMSPGKAVGTPSSSTRMSVASGARARRS